MPIRLGELLIAEKLLTRKQLDDAMEAQCLYGGRLGTSLIELNFLTEEKIALTLSRKLHLPYIEPRLLMNIPAEVIALVPQRLARKHLVIPCRLEKKRLFLAMSDPTNLTIIDALAFRLGFIIVPVVVPEIRLMLALQKYYQHELSLRFQSLSQKLATRKHQKRESLTPKKKQKKDEIIDLADEDLLDADSSTEENWPLLGEHESLDTLSDSEYQGLVSLPDHLAVNSTADPTSDPSAPSSTTEIEKLRTGALHPFRLFSEQLNKAENRDDIADAIINYAAPLRGGIGLMMVKNGEAIGWKALSEGEPLSDFDQLQIPLNQPSVLQTVAENQSYYTGMLPKEVNNLLLSSYFSHTPPETVLLFPLYLRGRLVTLLYLQGIDANNQERVSDYQKVMNSAAMAFEMLIIKNKIRMG